MLGSIYTINRGELKQGSFDRVELQHENTTIHVSNVQKNSDNSFNGIIDYFTQDEYEEEPKYLYLDLKSGETIIFSEQNIFSKY